MLLQLPYSLRWILYQPTVVSEFVSNLRYLEIDAKMLSIECVISQTYWYCFVSPFVTENLDNVKIIFFYFRLKVLSLELFSINFLCFFLLAYWFVYGFAFIFFLPSYLPSSLICGIWKFLGWGVEQKLQLQICTTAMATPDLSHILQQCQIFFFFFSFPFFSFQSCACGMCKFPDQGSSRSCSCWPTPQPQQCRILAASAVYTTAHSSAKSLTHGARPGIEPTSSWVLVGFLTC